MESPERGTKKKGGEEGQSDGEDEDQEEGGQRGMSKVKVLPSINKSYTTWGGGNGFIRNKFKLKIAPEIKWLSKMNRVSFEGRKPYCWKMLTDKLIYRGGCDNRQCQYEHKLPRGFIWDADLAAKCPYLLLFAK